ncbi:MAG: hypothetical protein OXG44_18600 [Gammaproteobacteria bacterium]|nr:hypothetical protein [Gammaproteobacteria bacterium]
MRWAVAGLVLGLAAPVAAQSRNVIELQAGLGGVWHTNTPTSLGAFTASAVYWPRERFGIAVRHVRAPGDSFSTAPPLVGGGEYFSGRGRLHFTSVTARFRWFVGDGSWEINLGTGAMVDGQIDTIVTVYDQTGAERIAVRLEEQFPGYVALELFVGRKVWRSLGVKVGATYAAAAADIGVSRQLVGLLTLGL